MNDKDQGNATFYYDSLQQSRLFKDGDCDFMGCVFHFPNFKKQNASSWSNFFV